MNKIHILSLSAFLANVQLAHWQADTTSTRHLYLGELYDNFNDQLDELAEVEMGRTGSTDFPAGQSFDFLPKADPKELLQAALDELAAIRAEIAAPADNDLGKIVDEMQALINRTKFLLKI